MADPAPQSITEAIRASDLDDGLKLLLQMTHDHAGEELKVNRQGHAETAKAIRDATSAFASFGKQAGLVLIALVVFVLGGFMSYVGINPKDAAGGIKSVVAPDLIAAPAAPPSGSGK